jgi:hypothetical protein
MMIDYFISKDYQVLLIIVIWIRTLLQVILFLGMVSLIAHQSSLIAHHSSLYSFHFRFDISNAIQRYLSGMNSS